MPYKDSDKQRLFQIEIDPHEPPTKFTLGGIQKFMRGYLRKTVVTKDGAEIYVRHASFRPSQGVFLSDGSREYLHLPVYRTKPRKTRPLLAPTHQPQGRGRPRKYVVDLSRFWCPYCSSTDIRRHQSTGKTQKRMRIRCANCGKTFSENHGSILQCSKKPEEVMVRIEQMFAEGYSGRMIARALEVNRETVQRLARKLGRPKKQIGPPVECKDLVPAQPPQCPNGHAGINNMTIHQWRFRKRAKDWVLKLRCNCCMKFFQVPLVRRLESAA